MHAAYFMQLMCTFMPEAAVRLLCLYNCSALKQQVNLWINYKGCRFFITWNRNTGFTAGDIYAFFQHVVYL